MSSNYEYLKKYILKYQKTSNAYKRYKKNYDEQYRKDNNLYARFRAIKSIYKKKYPKEVLEVKLLSYLLKQQSKGYDITNFITKIK